MSMAVSEEDAKFAALYMKVSEAALFFGVEEEQFRAAFRKYLQWGHIHRQVLCALALRGAEYLTAEQVERYMDVKAIEVAHTSIQRVRRKSISPSQRLRVLERDQERCRYCGKKAVVRTRVLDHILPVSKGGLDTDENLVVACEKCHQWKGTSLLDDTKLKLLPPPNGDERLYERQKLLGLGLNISAM